MIIRLLKNWAQKSQALGYQNLKSTLQLYNELTKEKQIIKARRRAKEIVSLREYAVIPVETTALKPRLS